MSSNIGPYDSEGQRVQSRTPSTVAARELVRKIARQNGWLPESELESLPPSAREAIANLRRKLGSATRTYVLTMSSLALFTILIVLLGSQRRFTKAMLDSSSN